MPRYIVNTDRVDDPELKEQIENLVNEKKKYPSAIEFRDKQYEYVLQIAKRSAKYLKLFMKKPEMKPIREFYAKLKVI